MIASAEGRAGLLHKITRQTNSLERRGASFGRGRNICKTHDKVLGMEDLLGQALAVRHGGARFGGQAVERVFLNILSRHRIDTSRLKHFSIRWRLSVVRLFFSAEGEVYFSRFPSFGCCIKLVGLALVTDSPVFLTIPDATTFPTLNTKNQKKKNQNFGYLTNQPKSILNLLLAGGNCTAGEHVLSFFFAVCFFVWYDVDKKYFSEESPTQKEK